MSETIIVAVISLMGTLAGSYWANKKTPPSLHIAWSSLNRK